MRIRTTLAALSATIIFSTSLGAVTPDRKAVREAVRLYNSGMYERAMTIFESMPSDPFCKGYATLCAVRMNTVDAEERVVEYTNQYPGSVLDSKIHYYTALNLFDDGLYDDAEAHFSQIRNKDLSTKQLSEMYYKRGYGFFQTGDVNSAADMYAQVAEMPHSDFTGPAQYGLGYINYSKERFSDAEKWFSESIKDSRFADLSEFYIIDCRFNRNDYDYVIKNGTAIYDKVPAERVSRLSRMLSESYMVKGDAKSARKYLAQQSISNEDMTRSDWFHAGSVLYAVGDYKGAVANYTKVADRSDSLGQIANYHLGNSYIKTKNKVAALDAFKAAADVDYSKEIQEDAFFNYAKLAFDLNHDSSAFDKYLKKYSTSKKGDKIYSYIALTCLYNRDYAGAVAAYDNIDVLDQEQRSNYMKAYYLRAEQLISNGSYSDAIPCLKAAAYYVPRRDPFNQLSRYWMAESYYHTEQYEEAASIYTDLNNIAALDGKPEGQGLAYNIGYSHFMNKDYDNAAKWFDKYIESGYKADRADALVRRADCDYARKDYKTAITSYQTALAEDSRADNIYPYYQLAKAYGLTNNKKLKVETLRPVMQASKISPYYSEAMYELGRSYMDINDSENAVSAFNALRYNTSDNTYVARALIGLGMVNRNNKQYEDALTYYKQVVSLLPGSEYADDALLAIESIYQTRKEPQKYLEYVEQNKLDANKTDADKEQMYFNTAEQVFLSENYAQAVPSLEKYLAAYPKGAKQGEAYFYLAESYKQLGQKEKACEFYSRSLSINNGGSFAEFAMLNYAELSYSLEHYAEAYDGYQKLSAAALIDVNKDNAQVGMMRSAYKGKEFEKAVTAADVVLASKVADDVKREASYLKAKSYLASSHRKEAYEIFTQLSARPYTNEGAESVYMLIQQSFDKGDFAEVEAKVVDFSKKAGSQSYWLAKSFLVLGDSYAEQGNKFQAKATYESIRDGYTSSGPNDDILDNVRVKLEALETPNQQ